MRFFVVGAVTPIGLSHAAAMATVRDGEQDSMEKAYKWSHHHFPHIVDRRPIDVKKFVTDAGFAITQDERIETRTMPVAVVGGESVSRDRKKPLIVPRKFLSYRCVAPVVID